jgi:hypothetical protein
MLTLSNILTGLSEQEMDRVLVLDERAGGGDGGCGSTKKSSKRKSKGSHKESSKASSKRC